MGLESLKKTIGTSTYRVTQLQAKKGYKVLLKLMKVLGPAMTAGQTGDLAGALGKLSEQLDDDTADWLIDHFKGSTEIELPNGARIDLEGQFDMHFAGKYGEMLQWLGFCIEVNFADFLGALKQKAAASPDSVLEKPSS